MNPNTVSDIAYVCAVTGGFLLLLAAGGIVMNLLYRIPFIRDKMDKFYDSLPMSNRHW